MRSSNSKFQGHLLINYVLQCFLLNRAYPSHFYYCLLCDRTSPQELWHKVAYAAVDERILKTNLNLSSPLCILPVNLIQNKKETTEKYIYS